MASSHGGTARQAHAVFAPLGVKVIAVSISHGWESEGWVMTPEEKAGLLDMSQEVISIAGTSSGADTAIVCKPAYPRTFHQLEIREILAKPRIP